MAHPLGLKPKNPVVQERGAAALTRSPNVSNNGRVTVIDQDADAAAMRQLPQPIRELIFYEMTGPMNALQVLQYVRKHGAAFMVDQIKLLHRDQALKCWGEQHPDYYHPRL